MLTRSKNNTIVGLRCPRVTVKTRMNRNTCRCLERRKSSRRRKKNNKNKMMLKRMLKMRRERKKRKKNELLKVGISKI